MLVGLRLVGPHGEHQDMALFLTTHGVASEIERVIMGAQKRLVLVTPFLKLSAILLERLQDAGRRGVPVALVYGKTELSDQEMAKLRLIPGLDLRFSEHLHAKCYCNEVAMVVTSMNLHEPDCLNAVRPASAPPFTSKRLAQRAEARSACNRRFTR
jgi:hypothetical protein